MYVDDVGRIQHMLDAACEAVGFVRGKERHDLDSERLLALGLMKCIETVGEAAFKISRNYRDQNSQIPWSALIEMRHSIVHDYFDVDHDVLWNSVKVELPAIIDELTKLIET